MTMRWLLGVMSVLGWAVTGCDQPKSTSLVPATNSATVTNVEVSPQYYLNHAQPRLQTIKLWVGDKELDTELALNLQQISTGMMFRTNMLETEGMLFVFVRPHQASFYMRNTLLPLSGAYIDPDGVIQEIHEMKPLDESPIPAKSDQIQYVLEVKQGWFERNKVPVGSVVRTERGTLKQSFTFGR